MGARTRHWITGRNRTNAGQPLYFCMFHDAQYAAHATEQNAEFSLHVSDLRSEQAYYYMHRNAPIGTNRNKHLALYIGQVISEKRRELKELLRLQHRALKLKSRE